MNKKPGVINKYLGSRSQHRHLSHPGRRDSSSCILSLATASTRREISSSTSPRGASRWRLRPCSRPGSTKQPCRIPLIQYHPWRPIDGDNHHRLTLLSSEPSTGSELRG